MVILINFCIIFAKLSISRRYLVFIVKSLGRTLPFLEMFCVIKKKKRFLENLEKDDSDQLS